MSDHDEVPYIVIEKESGGFGSFVIGALVGAGLALLLAPRSGSETQEQIKGKARELKGAAEDRVRDAQRELEERLDQARAGVESRVGQVREAVEAGRDAARDARGELERKLETSKAAYRAGVSAAREAAASDNGTEGEETSDES
jgi:gas vesicle protein